MALTHTETSTCLGSGAGSLVLGLISLAGRPGGGKGAGTRVTRQQARAPQGGASGANQRQPATDQQTHLLGCQMSCKQKKWVIVCKMSAATISGSAKACDVPGVEWLPSVASCRKAGIADRSLDMSRMIYVTKHCMRSPGPGGRLERPGPMTHWRRWPRKRASRMQHPGRPISSGQVTGPSPSDQGERPRALGS